MAQLVKESKPVCRVSDWVCALCQGMFTQRWQLLVLFHLLWDCLWEGSLAGIRPWEGHSSWEGVGALGVSTGCEHWCCLSERGTLRLGISTPVTRMRWFQYAFKSHEGRGEHLWRL